MSAGLTNSTEQNKHRDAHQCSKRKSKPTQNSCDNIEQYEQVPNQQNRTAKLL